MKTEKEKLLISENKQEATRAVAKLVENAKILNKLNEVFESLDMGKLDESIAKSLISDGGVRATEMFLTVIASNCLALGNVNKHFVTSQVNAQEPTVNAFKNKIKQILNEIGSIDSTKYNYSEEENSFYISEKSILDVVENYKIYLTDSKEIKLYKAFETANTAILALKSELNLYVGGDFSGGISKYFETTNNVSRKELRFDREEILRLIYSQR